MTKKQLAFKIELKILNIIKKARKGQLNGKYLDVKMIYSKLYIQLRKRKNSEVSKKELRFVLNNL